ncbi:MAG TPA: hypothetical protein VEI97_18955 [bacterium]|nr:hypothetical protein [bacterium]
MANPRLASLVPVALLATLMALGCSDSDGGTTPTPLVTNSTQWTSRNPADPTAGTWKPFVLDSATQISVPAPAQNLAASTQSELNEVRTALGSLSPLERARVSKWNTANQSRVWREQYLNILILNARVGVPSMSRIYAGFEAAVSDAQLAAWAHQYQFKRPRPEQLDARIDPVVDTPQNPAYPSDRAAAAGAAETMLAYFFPSKAAEVHALADEVIEAQLNAGLNLRSDLTAGRALGVQVANRVIAALEADGREATALDGVLDPTPHRTIEAVSAAGLPIDISVANYSDVMAFEPLARAGQHYDDSILWAHTSPMDPTAGTWLPLAMTKAELDPIDLPAPPANSAQETIECMDEVKEALEKVNTVSDFYMANIVAKYAYDPPGIWFVEALDKQLAASGYSAVRVARATGIAHLAIHDGLLACWREKYRYNKPRPHMLDPQMVTNIPTPPHPSYPSGHATCGGAGDTVLRALFPDTAAEYGHLFHENNNARVWGGVHYRYDMTAGNQVGQQVAELLLERYWPE